tara:strand:+ start:67 stop:312 length:246 start_codon:yes stop_codon:yes gene_type:complete
MITSHAPRPKGLVDRVNLVAHLPLCGRWMSGGLGKTKEIHPPRPYRPHQVDDTCPYITLHPNPPPTGDDPTQKTPTNRPAH